VIERGYLGRALQIVGADPATYIVGGLVLHLLSLVSLGLLMGPTVCGLIWVTLRHIRGEEVSLADLFRGFDCFGNAILAGLVFCLMVGAGLILGVLPGIILGALFCFTFPFIVDQGLPLSEAMAASRKLGSGQVDLLDKCLFFLQALVLGLSGAILLLVGLVITWPLLWAVVAVAYDDLAAPASKAEDAAELS